MDCAGNAPDAAYVDEETGKPQVACGGSAAAAQCSLTPGLPFRVIADYGSFRLTDSSGGLPSPNIAVTFDNGQSPVTLVGNVPMPQDDAGELLRDDAGTPHWVSSTDILLPSLASLNAITALVTVTGGTGYQGSSPVRFPVNAPTIGLSTTNCSNAGPDAGSDAGLDAGACTVTTDEGTLGLLVTAPANLATQSIAITGILNGVPTTSPASAMLAANGTRSSATVSVAIPAVSGTWTLTATVAGFSSQAVSVTLKQPGLTLTGPSTWCISDAGQACSVPADLGTLGLTVTVADPYSEPGFTITSTLNGAASVTVASTAFAQVDGGSTANVSVPVPETPGAWIIQAQSGAFPLNPLPVTINAPDAGEFILVSPPANYIVDDGLAELTLTVPLTLHGDSGANHLSAGNAAAHDHRPREVRHREQLQGRGVRGARAPAADLVRRVDSRSVRRARCFGRTRTQGSPRPHRPR